MARAIATTRTVASNRVNIRPMANALSYPGSGTSFTTLDSNTLFDSTKIWAIEFWANMETYYAVGSGAQGLFNFKTDQGVAFAIYMQTGTAAPLKFGANSLFTALQPSNGARLLANLRRGWNQYVIRFDGVDRTAVSGYTLSVNTTDFPLSASAVPSATALTNTIGILGATFIGQSIISTVRIWNGGTAMTSAQISALYNSNVLPSGPTLIREYLTQEGSGTTLTDSSGNGQNGSIAAGVSWVTNGPLKARTGASARNVAS